MRLGQPNEARHKWSTSSTLSASRYRSTARLPSNDQLPDTIDAMIIVSRYNPLATPEPADPARSISPATRSKEPTNDHGTEGAKRTDAVEVNSPVDRLNNGLKDKHIHYDDDIPPLKYIAIMYIIVSSILTSHIHQRLPASHSRPSKLQSNLTSIPPNNGKGPIKCPSAAQSISTPIISL